MIELVTLCNMKSGTKSSPFFLLQDQH